MFPAALLLVLLIVTTPVILIFDGPITHGVVVATAAALAAIVGLRIRPGEAAFLSSVIRPIAIVAAFPALWILIQVVPLGAIGLAHPIWESAAATLGRPLAGSISIDPGATLICLVRYLSMVAIAFGASAVAVDRHRAESILFALTVATTLIGLLILTAGLGGLTLLSDHDGSSARIAASDSATLGIILAAAGALHALERGNLRAQDQGKSALSFQLAFVACLGAAVICSLAVFVSATRQTYFAATCGIATLVVAIVIRRFRFGPWGYSAIVSAALVIAFAAVALQPGGRTMDLTVAFAARAPEPLIAVTQRILAETSWVGTGAGTFFAVLPIYRDIDELAIAPLSPTGVATIAVEMGRPFLWAVLAAAIALVVTLMRGALRRGRDSVYSVAGASCSVVIALLAFGNAGVFTTPALVIISAIVGVAIGQSKSRSI
jgi:hypothetical protein